MQPPCPAALVTEQGVEAYLEELRGRVSSVTVYGCIHKMRRAAEILDPDRCFRWLREIEAELDFVKRPKPKHHRIVTTDRLVDEGLRLFEGAATSSTPLRRARTARNGLMIALLALCPIRLRSFASLTLGETFVEIDGRWWIVLPPEETKSGRPDERPVPDILSVPLRIWLETYRPAFGCPGNALWPTGKGGALTAGAIERIICDATRVAFSHAVNPHLFRACAVTTMAIHSGENMGTASALLQHADPKTTEAYYNKGRMVEAAMEYAAIVSDESRKRCNVKPEVHG